MPLHIQESGALCFGIDNRTSVAAKRTQIARFKAAASEYGLCFERIGMTQSVNKDVDDGFMLVCPPAGGHRPRLFNADGTISDDLLNESAPPSQRRRQTMT
jgi:hypothetical protein